MSTKTESQQTAHVPVLLQEVCTVLSVQPNDVVVDCTVGGGGHAAGLLSELGPHGRYLGIDADRDALTRVRERIGDDERVTLIQGNFRDLRRHVYDAGLTHVDKILIDLGLSSDQISGYSGRGFSFTHDEPLLMTIESAPEEETLTAYTVVNEWAESSLADVIFGFGEERRARRIARAIVEAREQAPLRTSGELATIIAGAVPRSGGIHPATKTFQAIRIAVNDELGALREVLQASIELLVPGGRLAVIAFHSLEDRIVKQTFVTWEKSGHGVRVLKRPLTAGEEECRHNRRARSAKLRSFEATLSDD